MERWTDIPGFEGIYQVSDLGRVRSVERVIDISSSRRSKLYSRRVSARILRPTRSLGYQSFTLWRGHKGSCCRGGQLVLAAFVGPQPRGLYVCHRNGNRQDDRLSNLYYGTPTENSADARRHGTTPRGEKSGAARLTAAQVAEIRGLRGLSQATIAARFGISQAQVSRIRNGRHWSHLLHVGEVAA